MPTHWRFVALFRAGALARLLATNTTLTKLDLQWNKIRGRGGLVLARALGVNEKGGLAELDLSDNALGDEGCAGFGAAIGGETAGCGALRRLNLSQVERIQCPVRSVLWAFL